MQQVHQKMELQSSCQRSPLPPQKWQQQMLQSSVVTQIESAGFGHYPTITEGRKINN